MKGFKWIRTFILLFFQQLCGNEPFYFQEDGAQEHYHRNVRSYHDEILPGQWIGRRGSFECPPRSPGLTPLDFYFLGSLKDVEYRSRP
jgi:hypothetical protein